MKDKLFEDKYYSANATIKEIREYFIKPIETRLNIFYVMGLLSLAIWIGITTGSFENKSDIIINNQKQLLHNDSIIINHHLYSDSLYRVHLSTCSFISSDEVGIDRNDYFYLVENRIKD